MPALKYSRQREAVKHFLMNRRDHPTADVVYSCLRRDFPNISLGTVYRNLTLLSELGEIHRISTGSGAEHFDGNLAPHQHFICSRCHKIYDIQIDQIDSLLESAQKVSPGSIETCRVNFYGVCSQCASEASEGFNEN